ncbi:MULTISPECIES: MspA family porin [Gordonia]|uniref:MspA family porin n=1 Tax=Gordonia TaxID=2053 RepID=UPI003340B901
MRLIAFDWTDSRYFVRLLLRAFCAVGVMLLAFVGANGEAFGKPGSTYPTRTITRVSDDGWRTTLVLSDERVDRVRPLSRGVGSFEAFVDLRGEVSVGGSGSVPVDAAVMSTGITVACKWMMDGVQLGVSGGPNATATISWPPALGVGVQIMPSVSTTLRNGVSTLIPVSQKVARGPRVGTRFEGLKLEVSGCVGGRPAIRSFVRFAMNTRVHDNTFTLYGQPHLL